MNDEQINEEIKSANDGANKQQRKIDNLILYLPLAILIMFLYFPIEHNQCFMIGISLNCCAFIMNLISMRYSILIYSRIEHLYARGITDNNDYVILSCKRLTILNTLSLILFVLTIITLTIYLIK